MNFYGVGGWVLTDLDGLFLCAGGVLFVGVSVRTFVCLRGWSFSCRASLFTQLTKKQNAQALVACGTSNRLGKRPGHRGVIPNSRKLPVPGVSSSAPSRT